MKRPDSLKDYQGRVPLLTVRADRPLMLVDFPSKEEFFSLYVGLQITEENIQRYYLMMVARSVGETFKYAGRLVGVSKSRASQVESRFLRLMRRRQWGEYI
jgi:hypothetical protein